MIADFKRYRAQDESDRDVVIVDTGGANLASLRFALQRLNQRAVVTRDHQRIADATHVLLPGVGCAQDTMQRLQHAGLDAVIPTLRQPVLGICLGMQILAAASHEGDTACLGVLSGTVTRLQPAPGLPVPHMGWNRLSHDGRGLCAGLAADARVYFVHSFALAPHASTCATTRYGVQISAAVQSGNFFGTQFHPERSGPAGATVLANFLRMRSGSGDQRSADPTAAMTSPNRAVAPPCN